MMSNRLNKWEQLGKITKQAFLMLIGIMGISYAPIHAKTLPLQGKINQSSKNHSSSYVLMVGKQGEKRLDLLENAYGEYSRNLLKSLNISSDNLILDVGCGTGNVSLWMAVNVVPKGKVICLDISAEQLEMVRNKATSLNIHNVEFIHRSIEELTEENKYHVIYTRFVLGHLKNPALIIRKLVGHLKPGGILICEQNDNSTMFSYPDNLYIKKSISLISNLGKKLGLDFDLGIKIYSEFYKAGLENISIEAHQPIFGRGQEKEILVLSLLEAQDKYISHNLITKEEMGDLINKINEFTCNPENILGLAKVYQVVGFKRI